VPLGDVLRRWQGLGYPRRARNLHEAATAMVADHGGRVPDSLDALLALPGIGPYTARAVLAFAFERDVAVVDTNIARVLARTAGHRLTPKEVQQAADELVPMDTGWAWNQALMDLGATVCTSRAPRHDVCPLALHCTGRTMLAESAPVRRAAESSAEYTLSLPHMPLPAASPRAPKPRPAKAAQPFEQTTRYFRGRIVAACRDLAPGETLGLGDLGRMLRSEYGPEDAAWVAGLVEGLRRDGLVAVDESTGEARVSLP
jgi:A/G-specific adenine glycosylase